MLITFMASTAPGSGSSTLAEDNELVSHMEWCNITEPGMPWLDAPPFDQGNQQQFLWGFSGILWPEGIIPPPIDEFGTGIGSFSVGGSGGKLGVSGRGGNTGVGGHRS